MTQINCEAPEISERKTIARRQFLRFLAGSPLLTATSAGTIASLLAPAPAERSRKATTRCAALDESLGADGIIPAPGEALNVFEFEPAAKKAVFAAGRAHALGLPPERRGRRRDARRQPHRVREVQHPRPTPDRRAQDRHEREDLRRDMGKPHLLLSGQQPRRLQPGGRGRRGARRRQAQAPDDPLHGRQREHRRREQGARLRPPGSCCIRPTTGT